MFEVVFDSPPRSKWPPLITLVQKQLKMSKGSRDVVKRVFG